MSAPDPLHPPFDEGVRGSTITWGRTFGARLLRAGFFLSAILSIIDLVAQVLDVLADGWGVPVLPWSSST